MIIYRKLLERFGDINLYLCLSDIPQKKDFMRPVEDEIIFPSIEIKILQKITPNSSPPTEFEKVSGGYVVRLCYCEEVINNYEFYYPTAEDSETVANKTELIRDSRSSDMGLYFYVVCTKEDLPNTIAPIDETETLLQTLETNSSFEKSLIKACLFTNYRIISQITREFLFKRVHLRKGADKKAVSSVLEIYQALLKINYKSFIIFRRFCIEEDNLNIHSLSHYDILDYLQNQLNISVMKYKNYEFSSLISRSSDTRPIGYRTFYSDFQYCVVDSLFNGEFDDIPFHENIDDSSEVFQFQIGSTKVKHLEKIERELRSFGIEFDILLNQKDPKTSKHDIVISIRNENGAVNKLETDYSQSSDIVKNYFFEFDLVLNMLSSGGGIMGAMSKVSTVRELWGKIVEETLYFPKFGYENLEDFLVYQISFYSEDDYYNAPGDSIIEDLTSSSFVTGDPEDLEIVGREVIRSELFLFKNQQKEEYRPLNPLGIIQTITPGSYKNEELDRIGDLKIRNRKKMIEALRDYKLRVKFLSLLYESLLYNWNEFRQDL